MRNYRYVARDVSGNLVQGTIKADNKRMAAQAVGRQGLLVTRIESGRSDYPEAAREIITKIFRRGVTAKTLAVLCRNFATMLSAGLPISAIMDVLCEQSSDRQLKAALADIRTKVQGGETLSKGLAAYPGIFPEIMVAMVESGEVGGILDTTVERLAVQLEKDYRTRNRVRNAMIYPSVVMAIALMALIFIVTFVFPTFMQMFAGMKVELPLITRVMIFVSDKLRSYGLYVLALTVPAVLVAGRYWGRGKGQTIAERALFALPVFGDLVRKASVARFCRTLASLLRGGVPIIAALDVVKKVVGNSLFAKAINHAQESLQRGQGLSKPMRESQIFPLMVIQMITVGEEAGTLDQMLDKAADFYESEVDDTVSTLSSLLEPALIIFIGISVGTMVISVVLPMFQLLGGMGR
ncbi:MAG: type II secretion system F family protein [Negativicutes bacterium]|nr:type II secretion system F family protein [Negativicutes bacterium]